MSPKAKITLPIDPYLEEIRTSYLAHPTLLIKASPGSGKTTRLPWYLARDATKKTLILEPRRLAAKMAAQRIAEDEGFSLGKEVGYHFRFDKNFDEHTKLLFYTEGTFLKKLLHDPDLREVGTVILDEFHERHLETDVALAAIRSIQRRRTDFKIILMSATLDTTLIKTFPKAHVIEIEAPRFPVTIDYLPNLPSILNQTLEQKVKRALLDLQDELGHVLVFVPGMREMLRLKEILGSQFGPIHLLHAELSKEEQEAAVSDTPIKKIILSTNIAESSVTIPGVRAVIDSGIQREAHYSPWHGLKFVEDHKTTQSSAIQRTGRAGRTAPGICKRLFSEHDYKERAAFTVPEIERADLTDTYLFSLSLKHELLWAQSPPEARWNEAQELSLKLGATNPDKTLTPIGQKMLSYPLGARLSRVLIAGEKLALSEKRKLLHFICVNIEKDRYGILEKRLNFFLKDQGHDQTPWEKCILFGFIDQSSKLRCKHHDLIHYSGKTLKLHNTHKELAHDYYVVLDVNQRQEVISLLPVEEEWFYDINPFPLSEETELDKTTLKRQTKLGSIVIEEEILPISWNHLNEDLKNKLLLQNKKPFADHFERWKNGEIYERLHFWARHNHKIELLETVDLREYFFSYQEFNWSHVEEYFEMTLKKILEANELDRDLPLMVNLGGKRELKIHYPFALDPYIEAPIQDFYGLKLTPTVLQGKVPLALKLLGPHKMPLQITRDIQGFWSKTYPAIKKELQRDYPRHHWPEDPTSAKPILLKRQLLP